MPFVGFVRVFGRFGPLPKSGKILRKYVGTHGTLVEGGAIRASFRACRAAEGTYNLQAGFKRCLS